MKKAVELVQFRECYAVVKVYMFIHVQKKNVVIGLTIIVQVFVGMNKFRFRLTSRSVQAPPPKLHSTATPVTPVTPKHYPHSQCHDVTMTTFSGPACTFDIAREH